MYTAKITYPVYNLNSSLFVDLIKEILQAEFTEQRVTHGNTFLPSVVAGDGYLLNPINDPDLTPAFCAVVRASATGQDGVFDQMNNSNSYIIQVAAIGLLNLKKITDAIYIILNDMFVKQYIFGYLNADNQKIIFDSSKYKVASIVTDLQISKTQNDKDVIMGNLILEAEILEGIKTNTTTPLTEINVDNKIGANETNITQNTQL